MEENKQNMVVLNGDGTVAVVAKDGSTVNVTKTMSQKPEDVSRPLEIHVSKIGDSHIERKETKALLDWVQVEQEPKEENKRITLLLGAAGSGKSVIMKDVLLALQKEKKYEVIALKSDIIYDDEGDKSLDERTNLGKSIKQYIEESAKKKRTVLLIDQVDALSVVLSSHRKPLAEIMSLVSAASRIENVRIVMSCRQYDFYYDQSFAELQTSNMVFVEGLSEDEVLRVLKENRMPTENMPAELIRLLKNPLHLSLYYTINPTITQKKIRTLSDLYSCLWEKMLNAYSGKPKDIVEFLWTFAYQLYTRQTLSLHPSLIPSEWHHVGNFLQSNGFIVKNNAVWQFMHQTLFDYVFARLFFEKHQTLNDIFKDQHQGLFVRNQLKQVLDYQRATDPRGFIGNVRTILFEKEPDGFKYLYRFHIRHLILSMLASYEPLGRQEESLIGKEIFKKKEYRYHFTNATITLAGFNAYKKWLEERGRFFAADEDSQRYMLTIISKVVYGYKNEVLSYVRELCDPRLTDEYRKRLIIIIDRLGHVEWSKDLSYVIDYFDKEDSDIIFATLLHSNIDQVEMVSERVNRCVRSIYKNEPEDVLRFHPNIPHEVHLLYDDLRKKYPKVAYDLAYDLVRYIAELSVEDFQDELKSSQAFWTYNRKDSFANRFHEEMTDDMMEYLEGNVGKMSDKEYVAELDKLTKTNLAILHAVAAAAMKVSVDKHDRYVFEYLKNNINRNYHSSTLKFYHIELFKAWLAVNTSDQALGELLRVIRKIYPDWEKVAWPYENRKEPLTRVGFTQAQYYKNVPEEQLRQYPEIYRFYKECKEKYGNLECEEPHGVQVHTGYTSVKRGVMDHLKNDEDFLNMMRAYVTDDLFDFEKPTLSGVSGEMASRVADEPDRYYRIYEKALSDRTIPIQYCMDGVEALMKAEYDKEKIDALYVRLITEALCRPDTKQPATNITLCRFCDYYTKNSQKHMPREVFDYIKSVALHPTNDVDEAVDIDYNLPINRERGRAIWVLMECLYDEEYVGEIFPTLFTIVPEASVTSKVGMLFMMAYLLNVDRKKTLDLFLEVTKDYNHNYFTLPVHNGNPLLYLIRTNFDELMPYLTAATKCEKGNDVTANLLFRAWILENEAAKPMLLDFADHSPIARVQLIDMIARNCSRDFVNPMYEVLLRYLNYSDENLGQKYDYVFEHLSAWKSFFPTREYLDKFQRSEVSMYCNHHIRNYLKYLANDDPEYCLSFLANYYAKREKLQNMEYYELREITEILIAAYNNVRTYDIDNESLERAMDMLDELLEKEDVNSYLDKCLNTLAE